jgi:hypothetical protein
MSHPELDTIGELVPGLLAAALLVCDVAAV